VENRWHRVYCRRLRPKRSIIRGLRGVHVAVNRVFPRKSRPQERSDLLAPDETQDVFLTFVLRRPGTLPTTSFPHRLRHLNLCPRIWNSSSECEPDVPKRRCRIVQTHPRVVANPGTRLFLGTSSFQYDIRRPRERRGKGRPVDRPVRRPHRLRKFQTRGGDCLAASVGGVRSWIHRPSSVPALEPGTPSIVIGGRSRRGPREPF